MTSLKQSHARSTTRRERAGSSSSASAAGAHSARPSGHGEVRFASVSSDSAVLVVSIRRLAVSLRRFPNPSPCVVVTRVVVVVVVVPASCRESPLVLRMPFISKDWRSPGEEWVKTVEGWEKKKILECANNKTLSLLLRGEKDTGDKKEKDKKKENAVQPHCHITLKCTREIAGFNGLSDALKRLDFLSAVHDCRRFNYIVRLLDLLVSHRMGGLSGCAQRVLFNMLEEVALEVSLSQQQTGKLRRLIERVRAFSAGCCWGGRPLGSVILWEKHKAALERILQIASSITITQPDEEQQPQWSDLPPECRREVLLRLSDPRDIEASSEACEHLAALAQEQRIWRELAQYHFTPQQIATTRQNNPGKDWKTIFTIARRSFGLREEYAEMIQLCRNCRCLFWRSLGHPCIADQDPAFQEKLADVDQSSLHVPIPPQTFLKFFSL